MDTYLAVALVVPFPLVGLEVSDGFA